VAVAPTASTTRYVAKCALSGGGFDSVLDPLGDAELGALVQVEVWVNGGITDHKDIIRVVRNTAKPVDRDWGNGPRSTPPDQLSRGERDGPASAKAAALLPGARFVPEWCRP